MLCPLLIQPFVNYRSVSTISHGFPSYKFSCLFLCIRILFDWKPCFQCVVFHWVWCEQCPLEGSISIFPWSLLSEPACALIQEWSCMMETIAAFTFSFGSSAQYSPSHLSSLMMLYPYVDFDLVYVEFHHPSWFVQFLSQRWQWKQIFVSYTNILE